METIHLELMSVVKLLVAGVLAAAIGWDRERQGHTAGLRTHMLVALGSALFTLTPSYAGASPDAAAELAKGITAGVGFLGSGVIVKHGRRDVFGLTTAATIWLTAAVGFAAGVGAWVPAVATTALSLVVLRPVARLEDSMHPRHPQSDEIAGEQ